MQCPHCSNTAVRLRDKACARCGTATTVNVLLADLATQLRGHVRHLLTVRCPDCGQGFSMRLRACPFCGADLTAGRRMNEFLQPARERGHQFIHQPPSLLRHVVQWGYLLGSIKVLGDFLPDLVHLDGLLLLEMGALCVPYLVLVMLVLVWIGPRPWQRRLVQRSSAPVKIGLLLNLFSLLLVLQHHFTFHWRLSLILAGAIVVTWFAAWVFTGTLWPTMLKLGEIFRHRGAGTFDPSQPQGRKGRFQ